MISAVDIDKFSCIIIGKNYSDIYAWRTNFLISNLYLLFSKLKSFVQCQGQ